MSIGLGHGEMDCSKRGGGSGLVLLRVNTVSNKRS
jgi:hypothetical protein